jgi:O-antigen/teichoic acid export membrane protein
VGVIQKQSIKGNIYTYMGVVLGFITTSILFPRLLSTQQIGLLNILIANAMIFTQFGSLGLANVGTKLFPYFFNKDKNHNGYLFLVTAISIFGYLLVLAAFFILKPTLLGKEEIDNALLSEYFNYIALLIFFKIGFSTLDTYYKVLYNAVKGTFLKETVLRFLILVFIVLFAFGVIDFKQFVYAFIASHCLPTIFILFSLWKIGELNFKPSLGFVSKDLAKHIFSVGFWGIISSAAGIITINIDRLMLNDMLDLTAVGIYTTTFFFGSLVVIPSRPLSKISSVVISNAWKNGDESTIRTVYHKSSITLFIIGFLILIGLWANIHNIFEILPKEYLAGKYVILIIGLGYIFDMMAGSNSAIILNSEYYKAQTYLLLSFVVMVIVTNIIFIPQYGILGAAIASALSKLLYNIAKFTYIHFRFKMNPFNYKYLLVIAIGISVYAVSLLLPVMSNYIFDIVLRSILITVVYVLAVYFSNSSDDISNLINQYYNKLSKRLRK